MDLSSKITQLRKEKKISLAEMAEKMGITYQGLQQIIKLNDFRVSQVEKIAQILDVPVSSFFNDFETKIHKFFSTHGVYYQSCIKQYITKLYAEHFLDELYGVYSYITVGDYHEKSEILRQLVHFTETNERWGLESLSKEDILNELYKTEHFYDQLTNLNEKFITRMYNDDIIIWFLNNHLITNGQLTTIITQIIYLPKK